MEERKEGLKSMEEIHLIERTHLWQKKLELSVSDVLNQLHGNLVGQDEVIGDQVGDNRPQSSAATRSFSKLFPPTKTKSLSKTFQWLSYQAWLWRLIARGVHPLEAMMHFPLFQISPLFPKKFSGYMENFPNFTFSHKIF